MQMGDCQAMPSVSNLQGWILTFASGLACCLGASVVYSDLLFQKFLCTRYFQIVNNPKFLVASLSLGAGVMLYSSLYTMLHEAKGYFSRTPKSKDYAGIYLIAFYFLGVIGSAVINRLIHYFIHHHHHHHNHHNHHHHHHHHHNHRHDNLLDNNDSHNERSSLLKNHMNGISYCNEDTYPSVCIVEGDTEVESLYYQNFPHDDHHHHHSPHSTNDQNNLMRIGIQTALAISIHKFPEGLITFVTSHVSPTIGLALFFAIALHNISEGFTIALPIYMATRSRTKSFLYASLLGGLSQPLGALIGFLFLKESEFACWDHNFVYGTLFATVGGLMSVISIQGMLPQAFKNDKSEGHIVSIFFFVGVLIMGTSSALLEQVAPKP